MNKVNKILEKSVNVINNLPDTWLSDSLHRSLKNHQEITCDCRLVHWHPVCTFLRPYAGKIAKRRHYIFRCTCVLHGHGQQQNTIALSFYRVWIRFQVRLLPCGVARRFLLWLVLSNNCQLHYNGNSEQSVT